MRDARFAHLNDHLVKMYENLILFQLGMYRNAIHRSSRIRNFVFQPGRFQHCFKLLAVVNGIFVG